MRCIVPQEVNHECHHHPLTLTSSIARTTEADHYRCDVCEEKEDFEHYVYHCEECCFRAHIECLFNKVSKFVFVLLAININVHVNVLFCRVI